MQKIFISYRRDDNAYVAGILKQLLEERFGEDSVFLDIDNIPLGVDLWTQVANMTRWWTQVGFVFHLLAAVATKIRIVTIRQLPCASALPEG